MAVEGLLLALVLDFLFGDPRWPFHPVRLIGHAASVLERSCRRLPLPERMQGLAFVVAVEGAVLVPLGSALLVNSRLPLPWLFEGVALFFALGGSSLGREVRRVAQALEAQGLDGARKTLSFLVSRDTEVLTEEGVVSSALETLSENFSDALAATLLYAVLGGPLLAWLHRTANTLDAMVGYKTERYRHFGWASARFDDLLGWMPARLSAALIALSAPLVGGGTQESWFTALQGGPKLESPNAGFPMAAFAGALNRSLCGPVSYFGAVREKPFLGSGPRPDRNDLERGLTLYWGASLLLALLALLAGGLLS